MHFGETVYTILILAGCGLMIYWCIDRLRRPRPKRKRQEVKPRPLTPEEQRRLSEFAARYEAEKLDRQNAEALKYMLIEDLWFKGRKK